MDTTDPNLYFLVLLDGQVPENIGPVNTFEAAQARARFFMGVFKGDSISPPLRLGQQVIYHTEGDIEPHCIQIIAFRFTSDSSAPPPDLKLHMIVQNDGRGKIGVRDEPEPEPEVNEAPAPEVARTAPTESEAECIRAIMDTPSLLRYINSDDLTALTQLADPLDIIEIVRCLLDTEVLPEEDITPVQRGGALLALVHDVLGQHVTDLLGEEG